MTPEIRQSFVALGVVVLAMATVVFGCAGTLAYWQAWLFLVLYVAAALAMTLDLARTAPDLLRRRLSGGPAAETEPRQKIIMATASAGFVALLAVPGLDHRLGWSHVPATAVLAADAVHLLGWAGIVRVFRANRFAAATIAVEAKQTVVSTGPYARIRHPMYAAGLVLLAGIPVALGSWVGLAPAAALVPLIVLRLLDEERILAERLAGYAAYQVAVPWRLVPGVW